MSQSITLSVVIVNYNVREFLEQAIKSTLSALSGLPHEIWVVDNASTDGSADFIRTMFPQVHLLVNRSNVGFAKANNQALAQCRGDFICLLNPDTIVEEKTFSSMVEFFDRHPEAGAAGCKVLNPDGSLQLACRRSFPTPWVAFGKISGLAALFPKSRFFGRYNLTYLDPDLAAEVEAISGSFMMFRRAVFEQVGFLDEAFFMYGEDLDYCFRIREKGWRIYYVPDTRIIHFKGESSKKSPFEQRSLFYQAMRLFVHKHLDKGRALIPMWILLVAIRVRSLLAHLSALARMIAFPAVDLAFMTVNLALAIYGRFQPLFPWKSFIIVHVLYSLIWLLLLARHEVYQRHPFSYVKAGSAVVLGWIVNSALTFFFKDIGFSRLVVLYAGVLNLVALPGWRLLFKVMAHINVHYLQGVRGSRFLHPQTLLVMDADGAEELLRRLRLRLENRYRVTGLILAGETEPLPQISGVPVLGDIDQIAEVIRQKKIQQVIFATERIANFRILSIISADHGRPVTFKWIPPAMDVIIGKASVDYVDDLPFLEVEYRLHEAGNRWLKRSLDIVLSFLLLLTLSPRYLWSRLVEKRRLEANVYAGVQGRPFTLWRFSDTPDRRRPGPSLLWWSVFKGDMSMVGCALPAAPTPSMQPPLLKPGWTGLERLQQDNGLTGSDRERLQLYYMKNYSVWLDLEIIFQTVLHTLKR